MEKVRLGDVCEIQSGGTPSRANPDFWDNGTIPWVKISDFNGKYLNKTQESITQKGLENSSAKMFEKGTILYTIFATLGETCILDIQATTNQAIAGIKVIDNRIEKDYLYNFLVSKKSYVNEIGRGVAQNNINLKILKSFEIPVLSIQQQKQISKELEKVTDLINKRKEQLSKLDELIKARFVELFGDPSNNPNSFNVVTFNDCVEYMGDIGSNGANKVVVDHLDMKDEEDYALMVRFLNFTKNDFTDDVKYISKEAYVFFKKSQIFGGELIICKIGSAGQNYVMPYLNRPVSLGLNQIMVRINNRTLMPYLYQYLNTDYGKQLINGCINGAVTKSITKTELKKIPVIVPPIELQQKFVSFVEQTDKSKLEVQKSLEKLELLKKALMQKYFG